MSISEKLKSWRDSYISIAINSKNNMLHQNPESSSAIQLMTSKAFPYTMYWKIATGKGDADDYALKSDANNDPRHRPIDWQPLRQSGDNLAYLNKLAVTCYDTIAKKGENPLCITFGRLTWIANKQRNNQNEKVKINTPVLLIPIKLNKLGVNYWLKPADDDAMLNPALLLKYQADGYRDFPIPSCGQWLEKDFDIQEYFTELENRFGESNDDFVFDKDFVSLDLFDYDKLCMYRDVSRNLDSAASNEIIHNIFGEGYVAPSVTPASPDDISPLDNCSILDSNTSQSDVIEHFRAGESFILEGPPGTGKTQTIVNMIAEALKESKKVLFVSNKMSALNAVKKKMKMHGTGIDKHCLLVQGEGENKEVSLSDIYGKLNEAYHNELCAFDRNEYIENSQTLVNHRDALIKYNKEFYSSDNTLKMSIYDIIGKMLSLGYNENTVPFERISPDVIKYLTKEELKELTLPMREIELLICSIFERFGSIENDIWYGLREDEFNYNVEVALKAGIAEVRKHKLQLDDIIKRINDSDEKLVSTVVDLLFAHSILSISNLIKLDHDDLQEIYLQKSLANENKFIREQAEKRESYRKELEHYISKADNPDAVFENIDFDIPTNTLWENVSISELAGTLTAARSVKQISANEAFTALDSDPDVINAVSDAVESLLNAVEHRNAMCDSLSSFTEEIFEFDHKPLLKKFRTDWQSSLQTEDKQPLLYNLYIRKLKAICSDAINTDFGMRSVYTLLENLEAYHADNETVKLMSEVLETHGITYRIGTEKQFAVFGEYLKAYKEEINTFTLSSALSGVPKFAKYLDDKIKLIENILSVAEKIKLSDLTVTLAELRELSCDYKTLATHNERIIKDEALLFICPSIPKNVFTDWNGIIELLALIDDVRNSISNELDDLNEHFTRFMNIIETLTDTGLSGAVEGLLKAYNTFYGNSRWFDLAVTGDAHLKNSLTYKDIAKWLDDISNADILAEYISYKKKVKELPEISSDYFDFYAKEGRRDYPINMLGNNYEIALLYAYYSYLVSTSEVVAKLSGNFGITSIESVIETFKNADSTSIDFNRKLLNNILVSNISHANSPSGNKHTYLATVPSGRSASVRRLFAQRYESILELTPCIMMSVYSVSKLLDLNQYTFDVVIFDEASQIPEADALTSIMRTTKQLVISGDPKQMPAFSYFKENETNIVYDDNDEDENATCSSILDFVINVQNSRIGYYKLNMHYRSNHESLIKYSNEHPKLYGNNLITFPSPKARTRDFGLWDYCLPDMDEYKGVTITGESGQNRYEVELMMKLIKEHFEKYPIPENDSAAAAYEKSLGIIVFGEKQANLLQSSLLSSKDELLKKVAGITDNRIFSITPVDKIQGDEMDEMILSLTYGRDSKGDTAQTWGHLVKRDGTPIRKFNVAVTRAKSNLKFLHSIRASEITNTTLDYVKDYLTMMENFKETSFQSKKELNTAFVNVIGSICESIVGADRVIYNYGESAKTYRVPISILTEDKQSVALGILCELDRAKDGFSVREYTRSCPKILEAQKWDNLHSTYAIQWIRNYANEKRILTEKLNAVL